MNSKTNHKVNFELLGGLGNQLFQWAAANYYRAKTSTPTRVDLTYCSSRFQGHPSSITELEFEPAFTLEVTKIRTSRYVYVIEQIASHNRYFNRIRNLIQKRFVPPTNGFFEEIAAGDQRIFRGYFQTYKYLQGISDNPLKVKVRDSVSQINNFKDPDSVAIHMRRGDYLNLKDSFGVLSNDYYLSALKIIKKDRDISKVVIFSNDREAANVLRAAIGPSATLFSDESSTSDAATLIALSEFNYIVTANSSFSWWAAMLNKKKVVVYPEPWFKSLVPPNDLIPAEWISCPAIWL